MVALGTIPTPLSQRLKRARLGAVPLLAWIVGVVLAANLWLAGPRAATHAGLAHATEFDVTTPVDGRVESVLVQLYQTVVAGDPLATLDPEGLEASIETARAELERLAAEVDGQRASLAVEDEAARREAAARFGLSASTSALEYPAELRAFHADEAALELGLLETRLALTTSEIETDRLEVRLGRAEALAAGKIGPLAEVEDLEQRIAIERARTVDLRLIAAESEAEIERARERRRALVDSYSAPPAQLFSDPRIEARLAGWRAAVVVQEQRLAELDLMRTAHVLRAPASGRVAALTASAGQFMLAGSSLCVVVDARADEVALWVHELSPGAPGIGDRFRVRAVADKRGAGAACLVLSLSPRVELMPQRLWRDARIAEYGRACLIGPVGVLELAPGERVQIDPIAAQRP